MEHPPLMVACCGIQGLEASGTPTYTNGCSFPKSQTHTQISLWDKTEEAVLQFQTLLFGRIPSCSQLFVIHKGGTIENHDVYSCFVASLQILEERALVVCPLSVFFVLANA